MTEGDMIARDSEVVVVSLNHRVGVLGFLGASPTDGDSEMGLTGIHDLILALRWIRRNVAVFGGDSNSITVAGHSGGAAKIATLLAMPAATGLFHRAILMGGPGSIVADEADEGNARYVATLRSAGCRSLAELRRLPADALTAAATGVHRPVINGSSLPSHPLGARAASQNPVPVLMGTTTHETAAFKSFDAMDRFADINRTRLIEIIRSHPSANLGGRATDVIEAFENRLPQLSPAQLAIQITSSVLRWNMERFALHRIRAGGSVHLYRFGMQTIMPEGTTLPGLQLSPHGLELPSLFDLTNRVAHFRLSERRSSVPGFFRDALLAFVKGQPPPVGQEAWPETTTEEAWYRHFGPGEVVQTERGDDGVALLNNLKVETVANRHTRDFG